MKKYLLFVLLIILLSASASMAGLGMRGSVTDEKPDGETVRVDFYGKIILGPDRIMSNALTRARGQFLLRNSDDGLELRTSSEISTITKTAIELNLNGNTKTFLITPDTIFCDLYGEKIGLKIFHAEDLVTISSRVDEKVASAIRMGPMFFTGVMAGSPKFEDIACIK